MMRFLKRLFGKTSPVPAPAEPKPKKTKTPKPPKPDWFLESVARYEARLDRYWAELPAVADASDDVMVLITPWLGTAVPMFCIETALMVRSKGRAVSLLIDDTEVAQNAENAKHRDAIRRLVGRFQGRLPITDMAAEPSAETTADDLTAAQAIATNIAIWYERGEANAGDYFERNPKAVAQIAAHFHKVRALLGRLRPKRLLIPGGTFGVTAVYSRVAVELGIPYTTFDSGPTVLIVSHESPAAHRKDVAGVCQRIDATATAEERAKLALLARTEFELRSKGKDRSGFQPEDDGLAEGERYDVIVPLNLRWDAAALNCERVYPSCMVWLESLLEWIEKDGRFSVCLREHPVGRLAVAASREDYGPLLKRFAGLGKRLRLIAPEEQVNTYDLMRGAKVVLPYTSTVGIEAIMLDRPAIIHTDCYYQNLGFCWNATSPEDYLRLVGEALEGRLEIDERRKQLALTAYYVTQCCSFMRGNFNPNPEPFEQWLDLPPSEILATPTAATYIQSLVENEDVPMLLHKARMAATE